MTDFDDEFEDEEEPEPEHWDVFNPLPPRDEEEEETIRSLLNSLGIESFESVIIDFADANLSQLRGDRFTTLGETIAFLYDIGILTFSNVVYLTEEKLFGYVVDDDTDKQRRRRQSRS